MIIGNFYFQQTENGNLLGEYTNTSIKKIYTEFAIPITNFEIPFIGKFNSTWFEEDNLLIISSILEIEKISNFKYDLKWKNDNKIIFIGEGFVKDNMLIGFYKS